MEGQYVVRFLIPPQNPLSVSQSCLASKGTEGGPLSVRNLTRYNPDPTTYQSQWWHVRVVQNTDHVVMYHPVYPPFIIFSAFWMTLWILLLTNACRLLNASFYRLLLTGQSVNFKYTVQTLLQCKLCYSADSPTVWTLLQCRLCYSVEGIAFGLP